MNVFKLEIIFFSRLSWCDESIEIIALSEFQLIRSFIVETKYAKGTKRELWDKSKKFIIKEKLNFPIVKKLM